ncbi:hypothetical protein ACFLSZ_01160 [Candidatus Bipolaricaulota bacterium]
MVTSGGRMFLVKSAYWLGIGADALWAIALLFPQVFGLLTLNPDFAPDAQIRLIMGIGASLMTGWTLLLIWAVREPIERRIVILLTAYPVVLGMFVVSLLGYLNGNGALWVLIKTVVLMCSMTTSYILSRKAGTP